VQNNVGINQDFNHRRTYAKGAKKFCTWGVLSDETFFSTQNYLNQYQK
jgi:hypothetical protein